MTNYTAADFNFKMHNNDKVNLFVYGSLRDPIILKSVCGYGFTLKSSATHETKLLGELAFLDGYKKVSPDNVYFYAVVNPASKIEGYIIYDLPIDAIKEIDRYEGKLYTRDRIQVNTAQGLVFAYSYLASAHSMQLKFGDRFHVNLIHELWLRKRIERFFNNHTRPGETSPDAHIERKAVRELLGTTERDLVVSHLGSDAVSDFFLEHELSRPLPSIRHLRQKPELEKYLNNYIALAVKQVILNQFEHFIYTGFRYEIQHLTTSSRFYTRTISLLVGLKMINSNQKSILTILNRCCTSMPLAEGYDLIDYVKFAVSAAESIFDERVAKSYLEKIQASSQPGLMPLGAELEFSNLGYKAVDPAENQTDETFDCFKYFNDFCLNVLTWKLGGYIDDHSGDTDSSGRRGFLELAPGRLNIEGEISKPATSDPWVLNQLIREIIKFYPVAPHSLHLSLQLRKRQIDRQKMLPIGFIKCLLALGGDPRTDALGKITISRMEHSEIKQKRLGKELVFARTSKRKYYLSAADPAGANKLFSPKYVQQYKFIRLAPRTNYEPLIMALKGLQISYNPADYLTAEQLKADKSLKTQYSRLLKWAQEPKPISRKTISDFLTAISDGLNGESLHRAIHEPHYIDWALSSIDVQLRLFNEYLKKQK